MTENVSSMRDTFEWMLTDEAVAAGKPVLGICRGLHDIIIEPGTRLHQLLGVERLGVNSTHHQAIRDLAPGFIVSARADDGVIEAIECIEKKIMAVQFHPERRAVGGDMVFTKIWE